MFSGVSSYVPIKHTFYFGKRPQYITHMHIKADDNRDQQTASDHVFLSGLQVFGH